MPLILAGAILKSTRNIYFWHELQAATIKSKQKKKEIRLNMLLNVFEAI